MALARDLKGPVATTFDAPPEVREVIDNRAAANRWLEVHGVRPMSTPVIEEASSVLAARGWLALLRPKTKP